MAKTKDTNNILHGIVTHDHARKPAKVYKLMDSTWTGTANANTETMIPGDGAQRSYTKYGILPYMGIHTSPKHNQESTNNDNKMI